MNEILVVGGSTYDITAKILGDTVPCDSNPSVIYSAAGGVGRNIAENMARMGLDVSLMSVFGTDVFSRALADSCEELRVDTSHSYICEGAGACKYLSILDKSGELIMAASDFTASEQMPVEWVEAERAYLERFPFVYIDANSTEPVLIALAGVLKGKIFADGVSVTKAPRLCSILDCVDTLKVNRGELSAISGLPAENISQVRKGAENLISRGVRRVFVTMGTDGCCCVMENSFLQAPAFPVEVTNVNGAGDAFAGAVIYGTVRSRSEEDILLLGTAASHIALQSPKAVSSEMTEEALLKLYGTIKDNCRNTIR